MTSSAPIGSYTPGPNRNGSVSSSSRIRVLGWTKRDAGTLKPSGSSGVGTSRSVLGSATPLMRLLVAVVAFAVVRATALGRLGPARLVVVAGRPDCPPFHFDHGSQPIN